MQAGDTICAIASGEGVCAVGIIRISGPRALSVIRRMCSRRHFAGRRMYLVRLTDPTNARRVTVDTGLVVYMPAPRSYTGEDTVEFFGHGNPINLQRVLRLMVGQGARLAEPGEFTRRAYVNGRLDLSQAEAVAGLLSARSERALDNAQRLLAGELGTLVNTLSDALVELAADLEACIDFADEVDVVVPTVQLLAKYASLERALERLAASYARGRLLDGAAVGLYGAVNSGKSTLFNALLERRRALVSEVAGTTRDYLEAEVSWDGFRLKLVDLAGQRPLEAMSVLEATGFAMGVERLQSCDLRVLVVDLSLELDSGWLMEQICDGQCSVLVANKIDRLSPTELRARMCRLRKAVPDGIRTVAISSLAPRGLRRLKSVLLNALYAPGSLATEGQETLCLAAQRQYELVQQALVAVRHGRREFEAQGVPEIAVESVRDALGLLGEINGREVTESVLDSVFARFCVGK